MIRLPPRSTLFPYTPLFRSAERRRVELPRGLQPPALLEPLQRGLRPGAPHAVHGTPVEAERAQPGLHVAHHRGDRKSTRLNSSHANISYAVFCLKKKTASTR